MVLGRQSPIFNPTRIVFAAGLSNECNDSINFKGIVNAILPGISILS